MTAVTLSGFIGGIVFAIREAECSRTFDQEIQEAEVKLRWAAEDKHDEIGTDLIELFAVRRRQR